VRSRPQCRQLRTQLGIPTSATAALLLAAFQNYNLQPGPLLFQASGALVWTIVAVTLLVLITPYFLRQRGVRLGEDD
jgi:TctA family transporter